MVKKVMAMNEKVESFITDEYWLDIGRHDDYAKATENFEKMKTELLRQN